MTLHILVYGLVLALLLGVAAHWLERALRSLGRPSRWIWATALGTAAAAPFLVLLFPTPAPSPSGALLPLEAFYAIGSVPPAISSDARSLVVILDRPVLWLWLGLSGCVAALFLWVSLRLRRGSREWQAREIAEEKVLISEGLGPAVVGLFRPQIVLPPWALSLGPEELAMVLLHETEHRMARDPAVLVWGILAAVVCPLNLGLWWMLRRLHLAVEADCDARVLRRGVPGKRYAQFLLKVAAESQPLLPFVPALVEGGRNSLERRLDMMRWDVRKNRVAVALGATLLGGFFLFLACEAPTPPTASAGEDAVQDQQLAPNAAADANQPSHGVIRIRERDGAERPQPLVVVDGVILTGGNALSEISADDIESIEVLKGAAALEQYGTRGENGVIQIRLKDGATPEPEGAKRLQELTEPTPSPERERPGPTASPERELTVTTDTVKLVWEDPNAPAPLYIIDGVIVTDLEAVKALGPDQIDRIEVVKGKAAQEIWGERGANGVVQIFTKK